VSSQPVGAGQHVCEGAHDGPPLQPPTHFDAVQLVPGKHAMPQPPQLRLSRVSSTHDVPQHESGGGQLGPPGPPHPGVLQIPATHEAPAAHACPHDPQLSGSVCVLTSQPSPALRSQSANPGSQLPIAHLLAVHAGVACGSGGQTFPHPPQLFTSPERLSHVALQHVSPGGHPPVPHGPAHKPPLHDDPVGHVVPHDPQCVGSVSRFVSQPSL
jgi:hypothetical protein